MGCYIEVPFDQEIESVPETGYAPFFFPNEGAYLPFFFTDETFTKVLSAIRMGAFLLYGEDATQVLWYFLQNVEYPVSICDQILECIETNEAVRDAITNAVLDSPEFAEKLDQVSGAGNPLSDGDLVTAIAGGDCDDDVVYGIAVAVVDAMDAANIDLLERIEVGTNPAERTALLYGAIPLLETLPVDEGLEFADQMIENLAENYASQMTVALKKQMACDLYCVMKGNEECQLNFDDLFVYFSDQAGSSLDSDTLFAEGILYIATGTWVGNQIAYAMMLTQVLAWRWASSFLGLQLASLATVIRESEPNPNWGDCDCAPPIEGEMAINIAASPDATLQFISKVGNVETFRVTSMTAGSGYKYASIYRQGASGNWRVEAVDLEVGTFYQWSGQYGIQTPFDAVEGVTYSIPNSLDLYCNPSTQQFEYIMSVTLDPV